jgi:hypothetical protein
MKSRLHTKESNDIYDAVRARSLESLEGQQSVEASSVCSALEQLVLDDNANGVEFLLSVIRIEIDIYSTTVKPHPY